MNIQSRLELPFPKQWPPITVLIVTYERPEIIRQVIQRFELYLQYPGKLLWRIADDGSSPGYVDSLLKEFAHLGLQATVTKRGGFGANLNHGLKAAFQETNYVFLSEDDWATLDFISLSKAAWLLESVPGIGLVRYDEVGFDMQYHAAVLRHPCPELKDIWVRYFVIGKASKYIYPGGHPNLVHKRYYEEEGEIASVERHFSGILATKPGPEIVVMAEYIGVPKFSHLGKTWKGTEADLFYGVR
jgi:glycosyltransferase involved in cell wall biosynthesis